MALTADGQIDIGATRALGWADAKANWKTGMLLMLLAQIVSLAFNLSGLFDPAYDQAAGESANTGLLILAYAVALLFSALFYILFIRLFLAGRAEAFRLTIGDLITRSLLLLWRGFLLLLLLIALMMVAMIPLVIIAAIAGMIAGGAEPTEESTVNAGVGIAIGVVSGIIALAAGVRLFPSFFATAMGRKIKFRAAWRGMGGHTWRSILAFLPAFLLVLVPGLIFTFLRIPEMMQDPEGTVDELRWMVWINLPLVPVYYFLYGWMTAILAHIYRDLWPEETTSNIDTDHA